MEFLQAFIWGRMVFRNCWNWPFFLRNFANLAKFLRYFGMLKLFRYRKSMKICFGISVLYSRVPNKRTCTFIFFVSNFPPVRTLLGPVRLFILKNFPACTFILSCTFIYFDPILIHTGKNLFFFVQVRRVRPYIRTYCGRFWMLHK